jgi:hypothetical protein
MKKTNEIATTNNNNALDISAFGGFDITKMAASSIILVQGNNPLKKTLKCDDGTFIADNQILGESFEAIPLKSEELFDIFDKNPTDLKNKDSLTHKGTLLLSQVNVIDVHGDSNGANFSESNVNVFPVDVNDPYPSLFADNDKNYYQKKTVLMVIINGLPFRLVFKSKSKLIAAQKLQETFFKTCKFRNLSDPSQAVFRFYSEEKIGKLGAYYTINAVFERVCTAEEFANVKPYKKLDITLVKESEMG